MFNILEALGRQNSMADNALEDPNRLVRGMGVDMWVLGALEEVDMEEVVDTEVVVDTEIVVDMAVADDSWF
jgi:hypothetical protein